MQFFLLTFSLQFCKLNDFCLNDFGVGDKNHFIKLLLGKIILISVPKLISEFNSIPKPNLVQSTLHKYNPSPVDFFPNA